MPFEQQRVARKAEAAGQRSALAGQGGEEVVGEDQEHRERADMVETDDVYAFARLQLRGPPADGEPFSPLVSKTPLTIMAPGTPWVVSPAAEGQSFFERKDAKTQ
jgi:hypothetical protein